MGKHTTRARQVMIRAFMDAYQVKYRTAAYALTGCQRELGFQSRWFCIGSLPCEDPGEDTVVWQRRNGNLVLTASAAVVDGDGTTTGLPFGAMARALAAYVTTEIIRRGGDLVEWTSSPALFLRPLLMGSADGDIEKAVERLGLQAQRLFTSTFKIRWDDSEPRKSNDVVAVIARDWKLQWDPRSGVTGFVRCTPEFAMEVMRGGVVPLDLGAYFGMSDSAFCMDLYAWVQYRMTHLRKPVTVPLTMLRDQVGLDLPADRESMEQFRSQVTEAVRRVLKAYPEARVEVVQDGVRLMPSPAHVPLSVEDFRR